MSSMPEHADLLDDSHPSDAAFQRDKFAINANKALLPASSPSVSGSANEESQQKAAEGSHGGDALICIRHMRNQCQRLMWSLRFQRPWEWAPWLQVMVFGVLTIVFFGVIGSLPRMLGAVSDRQLPTPPSSASDALFEARFEEITADLSYNVFTPSPSAAYTVMSCGMFFVALILLTML